MDKTLLLSGVELAVWNDWELGFDTFDIARRLGVTEAQAMRALVVARQKMTAGRHTKPPRQSVNAPA